MIVVNMYAGPDSGKTTLTHAVIAVLKTSGRPLVVEYVSEYAKRLVFEDRRAAMSNQIKILGHQYQELGNLWGKADIVVCDGPILHGMIYGRKLHFPQPFYDLAVWSDRQFQTLNIFVERLTNKPFESVGRLQNLAECQEIDQEIKEMLADTGTPIAFSGPCDSEFKSARAIADLAVAAVEARKNLPRPDSWFDLEGPREYRKVA